MNTRWSPTAGPSPGGDPRGRPRGTGPDPGTGRAWPAGGGRGGTGSGGAAGDGVAWNAGTGGTPRATSGPGYGGGTDPGYGGGTDPGYRSGSPFDPGYGYTGGPWEDRPTAHQPAVPATGPGGAWPTAPASGPPAGYGPGPDATGPPRPHPGRPGRPGSPGLRRIGRGDPDRGPAWTAVLLWTLACFAVPVVFYLLWAATRSGALPANCVEPAGSDCTSPRAEALGALGRGAPGLVGAVLLAVAAAAVLRRVAVTWRPSTVGIAAAVIGAGAATVLTTALT